MADRIGFMVFESCDDYEQGLRLVHRDTLPIDGILDWRSSLTQPVAVFRSRAEARAAITRTEHYRLAFGNGQLPERKFCKIVPTARAEVKP